MKIGIVTDIHYGPLRKSRKEPRGDGSTALEELPSLLQNFVDESIDLIVDLGDNLSEQDNIEDFMKLYYLKQCFDSVLVPTKYVLGNHEVTTLAKSESMSIFEMKQSYSSLNIGGKKLIFLDAQDRSCSGLIPEEQLSWLEKELSNCEDAYVFVHQSLAEPNLNNNPWFKYGPEGGKIKNRGAVRNIFEKFGNVRLVINGHLHQNRTQYINGIEYYTVSSWSEFSYHDKKAYAYAILEIDHQRYEIKHFGDCLLYRDFSIIDNPCCK